MKLKILLVGLVLQSVSACASSPPAVVDVAAKCPVLPSDLTVEAKRKPEIRGETGVEVAGRLVAQTHRKNAALKRTISLYEECRGS